MSLAPSYRSLIQSGPQGATGPAGPAGPSFVSITQANAFTDGTPVYFDAGTSLWTAADASNVNKLSFALANNCTPTQFNLYFVGPITIAGGTFMAGQYYFVSDVTPGTLTGTTPTAVGTYSNPVFFATGATTGFVLPYRPSTVVAASPISVASIAALSALTTTDYPSGVLVFTEDVKDWWQLEPTGTATPDGITVVAATAGVWVRLQYPHPDWKSQTSWGINPTTGSDTSVGTVGFPLKTWAEFRRRTLDGFVAGARVDVYVLDDMPLADPMELDWRTATPGGGAVFRASRLRIFGTVKATHVTGVVSSFAARNPAVNTADTLVATDGINPIDWTTLIAVHPAARIRFTSGAATGAVCYPMKPGVLGQTTTTQPWFNYGTVTPGVGDSFVVETMTGVTSLRLGKGGFDSASMRDMWLPSNNSYYDDGAYDTSFLYYQQVVADVFYQSTVPVQMYNCLATLAVEAPAGANISAGGARGNTNLSSGVSLLDQGFYVQGHYIALSAANRYQNSYTTCYMLDACVFDSPGDAVTCVGSAALQIANGSILYGSGSAGFGVGLALTGRIYGIQTSGGYTLKLTGTSGDVRVGTLGAKAWTDPLPWLDPNSFAGAV